MTRPDYIQQIIDSNDIVEYLSSRGHEHKSTNGHRYRYLCPFHKDSDPSFYVFTDPPRFHCFGCKADGDIINLVSEMEHISVKAAIRKLAMKSGITESDELDSIAAQMDRDKEKYDESKVDEISFKLSVTMYGFLNDVNFDRNEIIFVEKSFENIDKLIHAMDSKELERVYTYIVEKGIKARLKRWHGLQELKKISITGND